MEIPRKKKTNALSSPPFSSVIACQPESSKTELSSNQTETAFFLSSLYFFSLKCTKKICINIIIIYITSCQFKKKSMDGCMHDGDMTGWYLVSVSLWPLDPHVTAVEGQQKCVAVHFFLLKK